MFGIPNYKTQPVTDRVLPPINYLCLSFLSIASESRDPQRIHWMLEALMDEPIQSKGSFHDCSRLYALQV